MFLTIKLGIHTKLKVFIIELTILYENGFGIK